MGTSQRLETRPDREVLSELLQVLADSNGSWRKGSLTAFAALGEFGDSRELMVIGRAVNGWREEGWYADDLEYPEKLSKILEDAYAPTKWRNGMPMRWVSHNWGSRVRYNTKKSAFWRVVRGTVDQLKIADVSDLSWPSPLCWTNLYKVSPHSGGNPSGRLATAQLAMCIKILEIEVSDWRPRRILFLTGLNWAKPFIQGLGWKLEFDDIIGDVEAVGLTANGVRFVVAPHPQGRREGRLVRSIVEAFDSSESIDSNADLI